MRIVDEGEGGAVMLTKEEGKRETGKNLWKWGARVGRKNF
jgi:hypothetical protein